MADRKKVIKGLECCQANLLPRCEECPYANIDEGTCFTMNRLHADALALLKAQEPVEPIQDMVGDALFWVCGKCGHDITSSDRYCANCGRAVKWDG